MSIGLIQFLHDVANERYWCSEENREWRESYAKRLEAGSILNMTDAKIVECVVEELNEYS